MEKDVCQRMGIPGWFSDLSQGFDILSDEIPVGGDFGFLHPPYHNMIVHSGQVWGEPDPRDLSRCPTYGLFLDKLSEACYRLYESLRTGAHMVILVGDLKRQGVLHPLSHDMHVYGQPVNVVIKMQHNCASSRKDYGQARFIPIVHETMWITRKPDGLLHAHAPSPSPKLRPAPVRRDDVAGSSAGRPGEAGWRGRATLSLPGDGKLCQNPASSRARTGLAS